MKPVDEVTGGDPTVEVPIADGWTPETGEVHVARCSACSWAEAFLSKPKARETAHEHWVFAHPAWRNPELTCHANPPWDERRWCIRMIGHDGPHWTPTGTKDAGWWDQARAGAS